MTTVTSRFIKGAPLTTAELDANLNNINNGKVEDTDARANTKPSLLLAFDKTKVLDPRITYTRASTATYYDGKTIAIAEQNLLFQSQNFAYAGGGTWGSANNNMVVTANTFTAPDGTNTASTLTASNTNSVLSQGFTATAVPYTFSVYLYKSSGSGRVDISVDGVTFVTQYITNSWIRYSTTLTPSAGLKSVSVRLPVLGDSVYVWGAQLEQRSTIGPYTNTTTLLITNTSSVLQTANNNVARFDHNPITNESLGLLIEEQRTNYMLSSSDFTLPWDNPSYWTLFNATATTNTDIAPDGTMTASTITDSSTTYVSDRFTNVGTAGILTATISLFIKKTTGTPTNYPQISTATNSGLEGFGAVLNTTTGATNYVTSNYTGLNNSIVPTIVVQDYGRYWRLCVTGTTTGVADGGFIYGYFSPAFNSTGTGTHNVATTGSMTCWGFQFESGSFATSYIPTPITWTGRTSNATFIGANSLIQTANTGIARYQRNSFGAQQLLLENAATNLTGWTENFSSATTWSWRPGISVSYSPSTVAPDGNFTAFKLVEDTTTGSGSGHGIGVTSGFITSNPSVARVFSFYAKAAERTFAQGHSWGGVDTASAAFNLITGQTNTNANLNPGMSYVGNGWWRCWFTVPATQQNGIVFGPAIDINAQQAYTGDGVSGIYVWGAQMEVGTYPSSYIPSVQAFTSRSSNATFYDASTTALAEQNLITYSQDYTQTVWTQGGITSVTTAAINAPDGTTTGQAITPNGNIGNHGITQIQSASSTGKTISIYAKSGSGNYIQLVFGGDANPWANYDLSLGTVGTTGTTNFASIIPLANNWYRCVLTTSSITATDFRVMLVTSNSAIRMETNTLTSNVYLWGAQAEKRANATSYNLTTSSIITNYIPVMQNALTNVARYDYDPVTRISKGLLVEPAATNYIPNSFYAYAAGTGTLTLSTTGIAPDGSNTALQVSGLLTFSGDRTAFSQATLSPSTQYTGSLHVKGIPGQTIGAYLKRAGGGTYAASPITTITLDGTWQRVTGLTFTTLSDNSGGDIYLVNQGAGVSTANTVLVWGGQIEAGAISTSYIPTGVSAVTRAADVATSTAQTRAADTYSVSTATRINDYAYLTNAPININNGSLYLEFKVLNTANTISGDFYVVGFGGNFNSPLRTFGGYSWDYFDSGDKLILSYSYKSTYKYACSWSSSSSTYNYSMNGTATATDTRFTGTWLTGYNGNTPLYIFNSINPAVSLSSGWMKRIAYYPKVLSNTEIQSLTT